MAQQTGKIGNSDKSQTAVEWLFNTIKLKADSIPTNTADNRRTKGVYVDCLMLIKEAKQMEKAQSKQDYDSGLFDGTMDSVKDRLYENAEQYYNETYGK